jgi:serine/threonine-protein kinase
VYTTVTVVQAFIATVLALAQPVGLTLAPDGSLLIADGSNGRVLRADTGTGKTRVVASGLGFAGDVAIAGKTVYVTGRDRVFRVERGRGVAVATGLRAPLGITISHGAIVVADLESSSIRRIAGGAIDTVVDGLHRPHDVVAASDGTLVIADTDANRIVHGPRVVAVHNPFSIALGPDGSIYAADPLDAVVRRIRPDGRITVVTRQASNPDGVAVDARGTVYVADHDRGRILKIVPGGKTTTLVR